MTPCVGALVQVFISVIDKSPLMLRSKTIMSLNRNQNVKPKWMLRLME